MANLFQMLGIHPPGVVADDYGSPNLLGLGGMGGYSSGGALPPSPAAPSPDVSNMLQTLSPAAAAPPAPAPVPTPTRPARARSSIIDTIGRVSDVLARVGGAQALYQPTLDSRQDREIALGDHDRSVDMDALKRRLAELQITDGEGDIGDAQAKRLKQVALRLQAITAANPNADVPRAWAMLAQQAGIPADRAAAIGEELSANPDLIKGMAATDSDEKDKYGGSVIYGRDADGNLVAYQAGLGANDSRNILPPGVTPVDPQQFVNLGGTTVGIGRHSTTPTVILPNSEKPGAAADRASREKIAAGRNATTIQVAGMPARSKGKADGKGEDPGNVLVLLDNIERGFGDLHGMSALPGDNGGAVGNVLSALGRTHIGQAIGEQAGAPSAQKRLEIMKNVSALQQAMLKALPASATRTKFEQEMLARGLPDPSKMSYGTARTVIGQLRESFQRAIRESKREAAPRTPAAPARRPTLRAPAAARIQPRAGGKSPTVTNW